MRPWNAPSLRARLTWRMAALQALVLMAFAGIAAIPVAHLINDQQSIDVTVYEEVAGGLRRDAWSRLREGTASQLAAKSGTLWYYATDGNGNATQRGTLTPGAANLVSQLPQLTSAYLPGIGPGGGDAVVRRVETAGGPIWILGGGGPGIRLRTALAAFGNPLFLGLLASLTAASFVFIPMLVRQQLRGLTAVAAEADAIDVDRRGTRLSTEHVPSELYSVVGAVNSALQRLDDGIDRRQRFLADAAHELRTPIAILQTRLELLPEGDARTRLLLDLARLTNLVNQLGVPVVQASTSEVYGDPHVHPQTETHWGNVNPVGARSIKAPSSSRAIWTYGPTRRASRSTSAGPESRRTTPSSSPSTASSEPNA